eukprot:3130552-Prymnesium_polylepis.1
MGRACRNTGAPPIARTSADGRPSHPLRSTSAASSRHVRVSPAAHDCPRPTTRPVPGRGLCCQP